MEKLQIKALSSLSKVYEDKIYYESAPSLHVAKNQELNYQIALLGEGEYSFEIETSLDGVHAYRVGYVPVRMPTYDDIDDGKYERLEKGMFPDPLFPINDGKITLEGGKYVSLWVCIEPSEELCLPVGEHKIEISFYQDGQRCATSIESVTVYDCALEPLSLTFTQWFHNDCIASVHGVEIFSEEHWELIEKYIRLAASHGMNMLLTPVLTPPLDTEVGAERPTVQLAQITKTESGYVFDLSRLERYVKIATGCGIRFFEINHMFTQWGAAHAPKVIATIDGEQRQIFGWDTDSECEEYAEFLGALIPEIIKCLEGIGIKKRQIYFHVSDEPSLEQLEKYSSVSAILKPLISGCRQIDALSNLEFYKAGVVKTPVVSTSHVEHFIDEGVGELWCYYCCAQNHMVVNRFIAMPSPRSRMIGVQMFKHGIVGFLQWGYNFYYTRLSVRQELDPYTENDADMAFPAGDAFSVYPYGNGVIPSLRLKVFKEALNDYRLLSLYSVGAFSKARALIDECFGPDLTFKNYPIEVAPFDMLTRRILQAADKGAPANEPSLKRRDALISKIREMASASSVDMRGIAGAYNELFATHMALFDAPRALAFEEKSRKYYLMSAKEKGDTVKIANALIFLAELYDYPICDYEGAVEYFKEALELLMSIPDEEIEALRPKIKQIEIKQARASALFGLGDAFFDMLDYDSAIEPLEKAIEILRQIGNTEQSYLEKRALEMLREINK